MPRRKTINRHLPPYVTVIHGSYWYRPPGGELAGAQMDGLKELKQ